MDMEENDSDFQSSSDSEGEEVALPEPSKKAIYNREGLLEMLEDISWPANAEWIHKLTVDHNHDQEIDANDDITREFAFFAQALEGTRQAFEKVEKMGIPFFRPPDYYAEMVKTDTHMLKIKSKFLHEKKIIEEVEERKKARDAKKIAKEVQALRLKEKAKAKKDDIESVKKWRKQRQQSGFAGEKDDELLDSMLNDNTNGFNASKKKRPGVSPGDRSGGIHKRGGKFGKGQHGKGIKKREFRDSKFGHGGRKGLKKQNTAETTNDTRGFNRGKFNENNKRRKM